jgi:hypothetical protein
MLRITLVCSTLGFLGCSPADPEDTGTTDPTPTDEAGTTPTEPPLARDPDSESFCVYLAAVFEECADSTTTTTANTASCIEVYAECTEADFDVLYDMADCIAADCADQTCFDAFSNLSNECLGVG